MDNMAPVAGWKSVGNSSGNPPHDLMWSLQPIFGALQVFGIELELNEPHSIRHRRLSLALKMLIFVLVGSVAFNMLISLNEMFLNNENGEYFRVINISSVMFLNTLFTAAILTAAHWKWGTLWKKLRKMSQFIQFTANSCKKMRMVLLASIIGAILLVCINSIHLQFNFNSSQTLY